MTAARLKASILQLAVTGKLVPQDSAEEPAVKILKRILAAKATKGGPRSRADKTAVRFEDAELSTDAPFEIPANWAWCRLGTIFAIARGGSPRPINDYLTDAPDGLNWIKIADATASGKYISSTRQKIKKEGLRKTRVVLPGDLLLTNSMSFGHPYILQIEGCIHDGWLVLHPLDESIDKEFFYWMLSSSFAYGQFTETASGGVVQNLNIEKVISSLFPLPPLAEQKRIVARIEELMPLVEEYGKLEEKRLQLDADLPGALEKAILQDAIQGKLVPQDPAEGTAAELLETIARAKPAKTSKGGPRSRAAKPAARPEDSGLSGEPPFEIPSSWTWCTLGEVSMFSFSGRSPKYSHTPNDNLTIGQRNNQDGGIDFSGMKYSTNEFVENYPKDWFLEDYDILLNTLGTGTVGRSGLFFGEPGKRYITDGHLFVFRFLDTCTAKYVSFWFKLQRNRLEDEANGSTNQAFLKLGEVLKMGVPLPPLAEQKRIVAKVEQLLAAVRKLKTETDR